MFVMLFVDVVSFMPGTPVPYNRFAYNWKLASLVHEMRDAGHGPLSVFGCFRKLVSIVIFRGLPPQARDTPDAHHRVENHRRPQRHAAQSKADDGESEGGDRGDVVKQHRGDQSSRGAALRITSRKPACD